MSTMRLIRSARLLCAMSSDDSASISFFQIPQASTSRSRTSSTGKGSRGRARASREDRRCRRGIPSRNEAGPSGRHHHGASRGTSAPHSPDDGGNLGRKELNHHLPCTIYDDGAGSYRALVKEQHLNSLEKAVHANPV